MHTLRKIISQIYSQILCLAESKKVLKGKTKVAKKVMNMPQMNKIQTGESMGKINKTELY